MEIADYIKNDHGMLSRTSVDFLDFVSRNPEALDRRYYRAVDAYDDGAGKLQLWPTFVNRKTARRLEEAAVELMKLIRSLPQRYFNNDPQKMGEYYSIEPREILYAMAFSNDIHIKYLIGRGDYVFTSKGLKCVEFNLTSGVGGWMISTWEPLYLGTPIIDKFIRENRVNVSKCKSLVFSLWENVVEAALKLMPSNPDELNCVFLFKQEFVERMRADYNEPFDNRSYKRLLESKNIKNGKVFLCHNEELELRDDGMYYGDIYMPIVVSYGGLDMDVPIRAKKLFDEGRMIVFNGPITGILVDKLNLVILSENQDSDMFNPAEQELIKELIPWSRRVGDYSTIYKGETVKLLDFIRANREKLVLKPTTELGGKGVSVGPKLSEERWQQTVNEAVASTTTWMVQEYEEPLSLVFQNGMNSCGVHDHVWGTFVFGDRYVDGFLRVMPREGRDGVVNCKQGATVSKIIEVVEEDQQETPDDWGDEMQFDFS